MIAKQEDQCRLCLKMAVLSESHVIPEFLYPPTYDEKHRAIKATSQLTNGEPFIQKGLRERLLCQTCETLLSKYESYAAGVIKKIQGASPEPGDRTVEFEGIDYARFKLFQLSLLWRASIAEGDMFAYISLGDHEDDVREMIHSEDPGEEYEYSCFIVAHFGGTHVKRIIWSPGQQILNDHVHCRFPIGSLFWNFVFPTTSRGDPRQSVFLTKLGKLSVLVAQWSEEEYLREIRRLISERK